MQFNRFDILSAYYLYSIDYHGGQFTKEYAYAWRAIKAGFKPSLLFDYSRLTDNGREIYSSLVSKHKGRAEW